MPRRIGKYELGRTLGMGTVVSKVKVATNCETGKTLAIKIVDKDAMEIGGMTTRARLKLAPLRVFDHKNIAKVKEFMQTANQNHLYIVPPTGRSCSFLSRKRSGAPQPLP